MDNARKKIWICLLCAVAVAIVVGFAIMLRMCGRQNYLGKERL